MQTYYNYGTVVKQTGPDEVSYYTREYKVNKEGRTVESLRKFQTRTLADYRLAEKGQLYK
jgi:hypothetical protein